MLERNNVICCKYRLFKALNNILRIRFLISGFKGSTQVSLEIRKAFDKFSFFTIGLTVHIFLEYGSELGKGFASHVHNSKGYFFFVFYPTKEVVKF